MEKIPHIRFYQGAQTLFVHREPYMVLAGEIHNSSSNSLAYMDQHIWPQLMGLNMNTVLLPVCWENIEPDEGNFNFELIDGIIRKSREQHMHLILLWFGLWKNSESNYVPKWVKTDTTRYFRAVGRYGESLNTISPFCDAAVQKDAITLSKLMSYLREMDGEENTVIAVQIENEIGLLGTDRDYSKIAEAAFLKNVPEEIENEFGVKGTWEECFGYDACEYFMCFQYAGAIEKITNAAQAEYPLPCYANAWLKQYPWYTGSYPCGGPVASMHRIWKRTAPSLFCLAPDIYVPDVPSVMAEYASADNPLLIPEIRKDAITASYALYAFGHYHAIGYSPFGIEELSMNPEDIHKPPMEVMIALNIDPSAFDIRGSKECLSDVYTLLQDIQPMYYQKRGNGQLKCYLKKNEMDFGSLLSFANYDFSVAYTPKEAGKPTAAGWIIEENENSFYLIGFMSMIKILSKTGVRKATDILAIHEGTFEYGFWKAGRQLNGDERMSIRFGEKLSSVHVTLYQYD